MNKSLLEERHFTNSFMLVTLNQIVFKNSKYFRNVTLKMENKTDLNAKFCNHIFDYKLLFRYNILDADIDRSESEH